jgi:enediyne biosynthesis protein E7
VGNVLAYERDRPEFLRQCAREYGDVVRFSKRTWLIAHPILAQEVLRKGNSETRKIHNFLRQPVDEADTRTWMEARRAALSGLGRRALHRISLELSAETDRWAMSRHEAERIDVFSEMQSLTAPAIARACVGCDAPSVIGPVGQLLRALFPIVASPFQFPGWLPMKRQVREWRVERSLRRLLLDLLQRRRAMPEHPAQDLLDDLVLARALPDHATVSVLMSVLLAGYGVPAAAMTWVTFLLARRPHARLELDRELARHLSGRAPTLGDLEQLAYTRAVVQETLRLYPPTWLLARTVLRAFNLAGYTAPVGQNLLISPYVLGRDPRFVDEPQAFLPERWLQTDDRLRAAWLPFGAGPRTCMGQALAMGELALMTAAIAQRVQLRIPDGCTVRRDARRSLVPGGLIAQPKPT